MIDESKLIYNRESVVEKKKANSTLLWSIAKIFSCVAVPKCVR